MTTSLLRFLRSTICLNWRVSSFYALRSRCRCPRTDGRTRRSAAAPSAHTPMPEAVEIEVHHRRGVEGQDLAQRQSADDGDSERMAELAAFAHPDDQRH